MESTPAPDQNPAGNPAPEPLKIRADDGTPAEAPTETTTPVSGAGAKPGRRRTYRPSHRATLLGAAAVAIILAVNAGILAFVLKNQDKTNKLVNGQVSISSSVLDKLGVNNAPLGGSAGVQLNIGPNTQFKGKVSIAGDTNISGQLRLNSKFSATDAILTQLEAGNTALQQLNVNGNSTFSNVNLRNGLIVAGSTQLQGPTTVNGLLTVSNSLTVTGNVAIGGTLTVSTFSARSLTSTSNLNIGGHIITSGNNPSIGAGGASLGSNGTYSISGNDAAGRINLNIGVGGSGTGILVNVAFINQYAGEPKVVISPVGVGGLFYITNLTVGGFSVGLSGSGIPNGSYAIDYIVEQ